MPQAAPINGFGPPHKPPECRVQHGWQLCKQHSKDQKLLADYIVYMKRDKEKNNWSQEAGNVAKFLFYMDPTTPSLEFVRDIETTRRFFRELADVGLQKQTLANYLKSVKAFVRYSVVATSLSNTDPGLYTIARQYLEKLDDITSTLIKQVSKKVVGKRLNVPLVNSRTARRVTEMLTGKEKRPPVCLPWESTGDNLDQANKLFQDLFPVTLSGAPPGKKIRESVVRENVKVCYDKWRSVQQELRIRDVIAQFPCRRPSERQIQRYIDRQDWLTNKITAETVVPAWKPAEQLMEVLDSTAILKLVRSQKWKGLIVKDDEVKGKTVMTTRDFAKDEVVCDYHGIPISKAEGKKLLVCTGQDEMGYLLFYKNSRGQGCCIDAKTLPCPCHPGRATFGRLINHSRKKYNLKPIVKTVSIDGNDQDVIYLKATRPILCDEELSFDYGVRRKSFQGKAAGLEWLDD
ncbi:hypothetical protein UPYG_G00056540 [Umbra pygmaea]|uniref:SET domain-containing protein n=1 Tax=Umbra pygmaea TaxID=75934 RepID=A0ABD0XVS4_UMBPY